MPGPNIYIPKDLPGRIRVVVADDHQMVVEAFARYLSRDFLVVGTAPDGDPLVTLLETRAADCLLLDLGLPGRNGLELIPSVRALQPSLKILVVTMFLDRVLADAAIAVGADGYVPKDAGIDELTLAIQDVISGHRYLSPRLPKTSHHVGLNAAHPALQRLTPRQQQIVIMLGEGRSESEVARALGVSLTAVIYHKNKIMRVLGVTKNASLRVLSVLLHTTIRTPPVV